MPTTPLAVLLFLFLLAPGLAYTVRRERVVSQEKTTALRELMSVVFGSVLCLGGVAVVFALLRVAIPGHTPDFGAFVHSPAKYLVVHYVEMIWWGTGLLLGATLLGYAAADDRLRRWLTSGWRGRLLDWVQGVQPTDNRRESAWQLVMMSGDPNGYVMAYAHMKDGTCIQGMVRWFNNSPEEDKDRELVLTEPLRVRTASGEYDFDGTYIVVAASEITRLEITHLAEGVEAVLPPLTAWPIPTRLPTKNPTKPRSRTTV